MNHAGFFRSAPYNETWRFQGLHTRLEAVLRGLDGALVGSLDAVPAQAKRVSHHVTNRP